jgi:hypothetical protein
MRDPNQQLVDGHPNLHHGMIREEFIFYTIEKEFYSELEAFINEKKPRLMVIPPDTELIFTPLP